MRECAEAIFAEFGEMFRLAKDWVTLEKAK
jgi:hypothetical protein